MPTILSQLNAVRIVPAAIVECPEDAIPLADALIAGGLRCVEILLRTPASIEVIRKISHAGRDILIGAGSVLAIDQVKAAADAGARFVVSPGFNPKVASYCVYHDLFHIPGVCTPTEIEAAMGAGLQTLKFFPAETCGGVDALKAISGPYDPVNFLPTGGINADNLAPYLDFPKVLACGGTWIAEASLVRQGRFDDITAKARQAVAIARSCRQKPLSPQTPKGERP